MEGDNYSVGNEMNEGKSKAIKGFLVAASIVVYLVGIMYAEVHGYSLLSKGINPDLLVWALLGIFALGITAIALPAGLHFWFHSPQQKIFAFAFYAVDLGLLFMNAVADNAYVRNETMPFWIGLYLLYVVPATPVIAALGWSMIWILDPSSRERSMIESLRASARETLARKIMIAASQQDVTQQVDEAAKIMARSIVSQTLGISVASVTPRLTNGNGNGHSNGNGNGKKTKWDMLNPLRQSSSALEGDEDEVEIVYDTTTGQVETKKSPKAK